MLRAQAGLNIRENKIPVFIQDTGVLSFAITNFRQAHKTDKKKLSHDAEDFFL